MPKAEPSKRQVVLHKLEALAQSTTHTPEAETARAKAEELKIHIEHVQVAPATERDLGAIAIGHWFLENGDTVVVCDSKGVPRHHRAVQNLPDQTARQVARRLIKEMHGEDPSAGFYRKLRYPSGGAQRPYDEARGEDLIGSPARFPQ
jgi:hypothetical protein